MSPKPMMLRRYVFPALVAALSSCAVDLGGFEKKSDGYKSYYASLGNVTGLYDGGEHVYDVEKSLFNEYTVKNFAWETPADKVAQEEYVYWTIPFEKDFAIEALMMYVGSPLMGKIQMSLFYFASEDLAPKKIRYRTSPEEKPIYDDDGNITGYEKIEYDDPPVENSLIHGELELVRDGWANVGFGDFHQPGSADAYLHVVSGGVIYLRVENNSGFNVGRLDPVAFNIINLMARSV